MLGESYCPYTSFRFNSFWKKKISQTGFQNFPKRKTITIWNKKASQNTSLLEMYVLAQTSQLRPESNWIQQKENKVEGIPSYPSAQNPYFPRCHPGTTQTTYYTAPSEGTILLFSLFMTTGNSIRIYSKLVGSCPLFSLLLSLASLSSYDFSIKWESLKWKRYLSVFPRNNKVKLNGPFPSCHLKGKEPNLQFVLSSRAVQV